MTRDFEEAGEGPLMAGSIGFVLFGSESQVTGLREIV